MKEIDFLPEWYKEGKRRRAQMRTQYAALIVIFVGMLTHNLMSAHKIDRAGAEVARLDDRRIHADNMMHQFTTISKELSAYQKKSNAIEHVDSRIDLAAILAEISHVIGEQVALSRIEFTAEPFGEGGAQSSRRGSAVQAVAKGSNSGEAMILGDVRFRITLAGVTSSSADVGALVCRLEESPYFHGVLPSFSRGKGVQVPTSKTSGFVAGQTNRGPAESLETFQVSEFEIVCYLSNYEEIEGR